MSIIRKLVGDGATVLLTTQYLDEADRLAETITVLDHGRVIARGTSEELKRQTGGQVLELRPADPAHLGATADALASLSGGNPPSTATLAWSASRLTTPRCWRRRCAGSTTPAWPSPTWPCAGPASTTCS